MTVLRLGTRGSLLALAQSRWVAGELGANGGPEISLEVIKTLGDQHLEQPLHEISGKGVFTRELDEALLGERVQLVVHSLKDLPTELPDGLCIAATPARVDPRDVLVGPEGEHTTLASLKEGAVVGTSSLRRVALLRAFRRDVTPRTIRGNVDTRLRKLDEGQFDAIILAAAGLTRLGLAKRVSEWLERTSWLPAPGQGALALVTRSEDAETRELVGALNDPDSLAAVSAERTFLEALGGGCQVPIGALGIPYDEKLRLWGLVASPDGRRVVRGDLTGSLADPQVLGHTLAVQLKERGAVEILAESDA
ncbi:MAG: hydroxymethylbilane synthase [Gemmatimonadetes bacterium]|nr:hydroxymethylbilane synthase [Gemmatimonadota bacterium]